MAKTIKAANPFYVLLMVAGAAFAITACAYGVMTVWMLDPARSLAQAASNPGPASSPAGQALLAFLDQHGALVLLAELGVLAVATVAAIGTDDFWTRRAARRAESKAAATPSEASG